MPMADAVAPEANQSRAKVFISYSRKDMAFADRLEAALKARGFDPLIDRTDIYAFEEWWKRIEALIGRADTVVFVLSPDAVRPNSVALKEVGYAASLNKRFAPVLFRLLEAESAPEELAKLNFIFFDDPTRFETSADQLAGALQTDIGWIREHTQYGEAERRWSAAGRPSGLLLQTPMLEVAEHWIVSRPRGAPEPTKEIQAFVAESRRGTRAAQRLRWLVTVSMFTLLLGIILGLVGWINQAYLKEQINWYSAMRPYRIANFDPYALKPEVERVLKPLASFRECAKDCPEMIVVPAGSFSMGSTEHDRLDDEEPRHAVTIAKAFAVSKFDVTFADWDACVSVGGCPQEGRAHDLAWGRGTRPVINVGWDDAQAYVAWLSRMTGKAYRLPSEAEWEYAARAGSTTAYYWGDKIGSNNANCRGCGDNQEKNGRTSPMDRSSPMLSVSTIWPAMCGSGWRIAITAITVGHPTMVRRGPAEIAMSGLFAAVPGTSARTSSAPHSAAGSPPRTGITSLAFELAGRCYRLGPFLPGSIIFSVRLCTMLIAFLGRETE
jgi:formylglycine-generating enzyme required for sulfatase activity